MYPSYDLNPIAIEHWHRERLAADIARIDAAVDSTVQPNRRHFLVRLFRRRSTEAAEPAMPTVDARDVQR